MAEIFYHAVPVDWTQEEKLRYLAKTGSAGAVAWTKIAPNKKHQWLTGDLRAEFDTFIPLEGLNGIFRTVSYGVQTNRDDWVCNFNREALETNVRTLIETYNSERERWHCKKREKEQLDSFVCDDHRRIKWSSRLKECLLRNQPVAWDSACVRNYLYRPFIKELIYFDEVLVHRRGKLAAILPTVESETENRFLWVKIGSEGPFWCLIGNCISDAMTQGGTQVIPFYTYDGEDGARRENIPLSTLVRFVEKMRLTKDKTALAYNDFLTLAGIPEAAFAYRLGNRSALEWVIDQYQVSTDPRSGITNDPNREDEPDYIVKLIGRVITVSLETQKLIAALPALPVQTASL